jgi:hypothetical protein
MYLRYTTRKKDGKVHRSWRLVRSVRIGRRVIQQTVTHLGELDEAGRLRARALARALIGEPEQADLFDDGTRDQTIGVRLKGVRIENGRAFGNVYLALALWRACRLDEFSAAHIPAGKEEVAWEKMAAVLVAARLCEPSSELHIAEDWYRRTALSDLLQSSDAQVNKDRLYDASAARHGGQGVDHGSRHGERGERRLAARERPALHPGHAEVGTQKVGAGAGGQDALARDPRGHRGEAMRGARRGRGDLHPVSLAGPHRERKGDARALQCTHRAGAGETAGAHRQIQAATEPGRDQPPDRAAPATQPARRGALCDRAEGCRHARRMCA